MYIVLLLIVTSSICCAVTFCFILLLTINSNLYQLRIAVHHVVLAVLSTMEKDNRLKCIVDFYYLFVSHRVTIPAPTLLLLSNLFMWTIPHPTTIAPNPTSIHLIFPAYIQTSSPIICSVFITINSTCSLPDNHDSVSPFILWVLPLYKGTLYLSLRERRLMLRQLTWGDDFDLLIDINVAVNVSTWLGPSDSVTIKTKALPNSSLNSLLAKCWSCSNNKSIPSRESCLVVMVLGGCSSS